MMVLGMIYLTTHDENSLGVIEGQVLDDNKNTNFQRLNMNRKKTLSGSYSLKFSGSQSLNIGATP